MKNQFGVTLVELAMVCVLFVVLYKVINIVEEKRNTADIDIQISEEESESFNVWNGVYTKGNHTIILKRNNVNEIDVELFKYNKGVSADKRTIKLNSDSELVFDESEGIKMKKREGRIIFDATNVSDDSTFKEFSGEYQIDPFTKMGWDGIYVMKNYVIILAEFQEGGINIIANSKLESWNAELTSYDDKTITYTSSSGQTLKITKTEDGIKVESTSNNGDSILNKINGVFKKVC